VTWSHQSTKYIFRKSCHVICCECEPAKWAKCCCNEDKTNMNVMHGMYSIKTRRMEFVHPYAELVWRSSTKVSSSFFTQINHRVCKKVFPGIFVNLEICWNWCWTPDREERNFLRSTIQLQNINMKWLSQHVHLRRNLVSYSVGYVRL
jgi:hypothetical protein